MRLACFEVMAGSGVVVAIAAALHYCRQHRLHVPPWAVAAADELLCDLLRRERSNRRGRACGAVARHRQDMIDYARWDQVKDVRQRQIEIAEQVEELRGLANVAPERLEEREKMLAWAGSTLNRAFECAAMILEGSEAYGSPDAIKRSYFQVERNSHDPGQALRYHMLDAEFLRMLGLKHEIEMRPGRKKVPLHELTI
jgi:hypothetical protein